MAQTINAYLFSDISKEFKEKSDGNRGRQYLLTTLKYKDIPILQYMDNELKRLTATPTSLDNFLISIYYNIMISYTLLKM